MPAGDNWGDAGGGMGTWRDWSRWLVREEAGEGSQLTGDGVRETQGVLAGRDDGRFLIPRQAEEDHQELPLPQATVGGWGQARGGAGPFDMPWDRDTREEYERVLAEIAAA